MPAGFDKCQKNGGKIRRVSGPDKDHGLKAGQYVNYCVLNGKTHRGYIHTAEQSKKAKGMGVEL